MSFLEDKSNKERWSLRETVTLAMNFAEGEILQKKYFRLAKVLQQIELNKMYFFFYEEKRRGIN